MERHEPVLVREILERLRPGPGRVMVDGTVGTAGHAVEFLRGMQGRGVLVGVDRDPAMLERAKGRLEAEGAGRDLRLILVTGSYEELPDLLEAEGLRGADAVLLDLGINSLHVEDPSRGFSFTKDGPLDGRFNPGEPGTRTVAELVNTASEAQIATWLRELADERFARPIARRIVAHRVATPFTTTTQLADVVASCYPPAQRHASRINPATRTFQALRIVANAELEAVERGVRACAGALNPGGALCVISYHSGEDRITKAIFDELGSPRPDPTNRYRATTTEGLAYRVESRGALKPSDEEVARNPRARSARLRTLHRLGEVAAS